MKKTGFKDPAKPKKKEDGNYPWSAKSPHYDERTSCFVSQGDDYGVGHKQPVGHHSARNDGVIPKGRVPTMDLYAENITYGVHES